MAAVKVQLERETYERRSVGGFRRMVRVWKPAWTGELLYADRRIAVVRSVGSHQMFGGLPSYPFTAGMEATMWGHDPKHPAVLKLGLPKDRWGRSSIGRIRIAPRSVTRMAHLIKLAGFIARGIDPMQLAAERSIVKTFGGTYRHVTYHEQKVLDAAAKAEARRATGKNASCKLPRSRRRR